MDTVHHSWDWVSRAQMHQYVIIHDSLWVWHGGQNEAHGGTRCCKHWEHVGIIVRVKQGKGHNRLRAQHHGDRASPWQSCRPQSWQNVTVGLQDFDLWRTHGAGGMGPLQGPCTQDSPEAAVVGVIVFRQQLTQGPVNDNQSNSKLAGLIGVSPLSAE